MSESLESAIQKAGGAVEFLRNSTYPAFEFPVKPEWTNWRSEQQAWRKSAVVMDQSHHMSDLFIRGPEAEKFLHEHGVNTFSNFKVNTSKQYISVTEDGYFVGDAILFYDGPENFDLVGNPSLINWINFQAQSGKYKVEVEHDPNSNRRSGPPKLFRYEIQGPNALPIVEKLTGSKVPDVKFFHMTKLKIAGKEYSALRHGMAGQPGFEIYGPWGEGQAVIDAILKAGEGFDLVRCGAKAYATANLESGWVPRPFTAVFGAKEKAYREWLKPNDIGSLGGSMDSKNIEDFYHTPYDLGYGHTVKFDHDFLGRKALEEHAKNRKRQKVTLHWNVDDVMAITRSQFEPGLPGKFLEYPKARFAYFQVDKVVDKAGKYVGMSTDAGYVTNEHAQISLASIDASIPMGTELKLLWGENPNTKKPAVEPHRQMEVRATVCPIPFAQVIRDAYRNN